MNHIFLFQVHKEANLLSRILARLVSPNHYFAINIDDKSTEKDSLLRVVESVPNVVLITRFKIAHGGFSFTKCTIHQMQVCQTLSIKFDYYHTCSGQDYPCVSNEVFDTFFEKSKLSYTKMDTQEQIEMWRNTKYRDRLERYNFADHLQCRFANLIHLNGILYRALFFIRRPYPNLSNIWGGWNWFSLSDACVAFLLQYLSDNPQFLDRFRFTTAADELVFSTILHPHAERLGIVVDNSLRFIEWHPSREYTGRLPLLLDEREYNEICGSGAFFCRKIEAIHSEKLLDLLDERIDNMGNHPQPRIIHNDMRSIPKNVDDMSRTQAVGRVQEERP